MEKEWKAYEIGELDQYLFGQGNHYEIYKKYAPRPGFLPTRSMLISPLGARTTRTSSFLGRLVMQPMHWREGIFFCAIRFPSFGHLRRNYSVSVSASFFGSSSP